jgi:shikimate dehydrogenase
MDQYCVIGNPIQHSKSPLIHQLFAEQTQQEMAYTAKLVALDGLELALNQLQAEGVKGINITLPFKHKAFRLASKLSERAQVAQAINTIKFNEDGTIFGDNTDGIGLVRDILQNHHYGIAKKRVLVLGTGGAVRGILQPLLTEKPDQIVIANRSEAKATALAEEFSKDDSIISCPLQLLEADGFDLVINGTSASLEGEMLDLPASILRKGAMCYDMVYGSDVTPFLTWAKDQGADICTDGLGMLVEQAAESFYLWRGVRPEVKPVLKNLK